MIWRSLLYIFNILFNIYIDLYRHSGYYCPIFYTIPLFEAPSIVDDSVSDVGNYKFDTELTNFGIIKERVMSKISKKGNILKLRFNLFGNCLPILFDFFNTDKNFIAAALPAILSREEVIVISFFKNSKDRLAINRKSSLKCFGFHKTFVTVTPIDCVGFIHFLYFQLKTS